VTRPGMFSIGIGAILAARLKTTRRDASAERVQRRMDHGAAGEQAEYCGQVSAAQRIQIGLGQFVRIHVISCRAAIVTLRPAAPYRDLAVCASLLAVSAMHVSERLFTLARPCLRPPWNPFMVLLGIIRRCVSNPFRVLIMGCG
jgi:hypothetical protein